MRAKLATEPVEDLRVDAEDGYRGGPDAEDDDVRRAATVVAADRAAGTAPPSVGIRAQVAGGADPAPRRPVPGPLPRRTLGGGPRPSSRCRR